jgi:hypothetical protein
MSAGNHEKNTAQFIPDRDREVFALERCGAFIRQCRPLKTLRPPFPPFNGAAFLPLVYA